MAESPRELQTLLKISHEFAKKWNLKFNSKKSKVMVVGTQHLNKVVHVIKRHGLPWKPLSHSLARSPSRQTLSKAFDRSRKAIYKDFFEDFAREQIPCSVNIWSSIRLPFMPMPSQGHYDFHTFPVVDWFCLFIYLSVLTFPLQDCKSVND
jgi:hypothetical protein